MHTNLNGYHDYRGFAQIVKLRNFFHNGGFEEEIIYTIRTIRTFSSNMAANLRNLTICAKPLFGGSIFAG